MEGIKLVINIEIVDTVINCAPALNLRKNHAFKAAKQEKTDQ